MKNVFLLVVFILILCPLYAQLEYNVTGTSKVYSWGPVYGEESRTSSIMIDLMFLKLLTFDENQKVQPVVLAEAPERSKLVTGEGKLHLKLRNNVTWQSGKLVTADDVKFTWEVIKRSGVNNAMEKVSQINNMIVYSDTEMDVIFEHDSDHNYGALTFYLLPKEKYLYDPEKADPYNIGPGHKFFTENPVTNGKFLPQKWRGIAPDGCCLEKNNAYYVRDVRDKLLNKFNFKWESGFTQIRTGVINGDFNIVMDVPVSEYSQFELISQKGEMVNKNLDSILMLAFNLRKDVFKDHNL